ncbi:MAG: GNAT family N-acetyltransferase [Blastocatellia bacterium]
MPITVTNMQVEHIPAVIALEQQSELSSRGEESYVRLLKNSDAVALVAFDESESELVVVGCFSGWLVADEFEVDNVAVSTDSRRNGIASKLLSASLEIARRKGAVRVFLEVRAMNKPACLLYEKLGFTVVGRRKYYYRDPADDALILSQEIVKQTGS